MLDDLVARILEVPEPGSDKRPAHCEEIYIRCRTGQGSKRSSLDTSYMRIDELEPGRVRSVILNFRRMYGHAQLWIDAACKGSDRTYVSEVKLDVRVTSPTPMDLGLTELAPDDLLARIGGASPEAQLMAVVLTPLLRATVSLAGRHADQADHLIDVVREQGEHIRALQASRDQLIANQLPDLDEGSAEADDGSAEVMAGVGDLLKTATDRMRGAASQVDPEAVKAWLKGLRPGQRGDVVSDFASTLDGDDVPPPAPQPDAPAAK